MVTRKFFTLIISPFAFCMLFTSCSNGNIDYSNRTPECLEINYPEFDSLSIPNDDELTELKNRSNKIFETIKTATLINNSFSKIINFTVRIVTNENSSNSTSRTEIIKLNPGEIHDLGCTKAVYYVLDNKQKEIRLDTLNVIKYSYKIAGERIVKK